MNLHSISASVGSPRGLESFPADEDFKALGSGATAKEAEQLALDPNHPLLQQFGDRAFDLYDPSAFFVGALPGPAAPGLAQGNAAFLLFPLGGDDDEEDSGIQLPTVFYSRPLGGIKNAVGALVGGIVATASPDGTIQLGAGGAARIGPCLVFLNTRSVGSLDPEAEQTLIPNANGDFTATINFGIGLSLQDLGSGTSRIWSMIAGLAGGPFGPAAASGLQGLAGALDGSKQFANLFAGFGYAIQVQGNVNDPGNLTFLQNGREIDLESTIEAFIQTLSGEASEPMYFPESADSPEQVRTINDIIALAYGAADPFELARQRGAQSAVPAVQLAFEANAVVRVIASTLYPFLGDWAQGMAAHGPSSIEEVGRFLQEVWHNPAMPPQIRADVVDRLSNGYGFNFGIPEIAVRNEAFAPPPDLEATRAAFGH